MAQSGTEFKWNKPKEEAAQLLAEGELVDEEVAEKTGISRRQIIRLKQSPEFAARVEEITKDLGDIALRRAIARRSRRVAALNSRWLAMQRVIEERGADPSMADVPGGTTGLIVRQYKGVGGGDNFSMVEEYEVDTGLLRELREHEKQAAQELGQWVDNVDHTSGGQPFKVYLGVDVDRV